MSALTFESIAQDEIHTSGSHSLGDHVGYVIALTKFGEGRVRDLALYEGATSYGETVEMAREIRAILPRENYARIDVLYSNGDRGIL
jgi:hypothetical protein